MDGIDTGEGVGLEDRLRQSLEETQRRSRLQESLDEVEQRKKVVEGAPSKPVVERVVTKLEQERMRDVRRRIAEKWRNIDAIARETPGTQLYIQHQEDLRGEPDQAWADRFKDDIEAAQAMLKRQGKGAESEPTVLPRFKTNATQVAEILRDFNPNRFTQRALYEVRDPKLWQEINEMTHVINLGKDGVFDFIKVAIEAKREQAAAEKK